MVAATFLEICNNTSVILIRNIQENILLIFEQVSLLTIKFDPKFKVCFNDQ